MSSSSRSRCSIDEALRRLDVLEVDAAPALAEKLDAIDDLVGVLGRDLEVDRVDVGEALEQHRLAFHHRLGGQRAAIAEAEDGGAVGDDGDEVALGGVVVGVVLVVGDRQHRHRDAGRIGERQVALGRHRLGGDDFELAGPALAVKQQRFLIGEGRPLAGAVVFCDISTPWHQDRPARGPGGAAPSGLSVGARDGDGVIDRPACLAVALAWFWEVHGVGFRHRN